VNNMSTRQKYLAIVILVSAWPCALLAQAPAPALSQPAQSQSQAADSGGDESDLRVPVPSIVSIDEGSMVFLSHMERSNYLRGGISLGSFYDDNVFNQSTDQVGGYSLTAQPHVAVDVSTTRLALKTQYSAGFTMNQRLSSQNQGNHGLLSDLSYRLSPHVSLNIHDNFSITTGFFDQVQSDSSFSTGGVLQQPNGYVITPLSKSTNNIGSAQLSYQFGAGSLVGFSGTSFINHYRDVPAGSNLVDTTGESASAFYTHRVTPRNWVGVRYGFQRLTFDPLAEGSTTHSVFYFHTINLTSHMELSFFAGPEYTSLNSQVVSTIVELPYVLVLSTPVSNSMWNGAAGVSFGWQLERTALQAQFVRRVSDGGGVQGSVNLNALTGQVSRQITSKTTISVGASHAAMDPLSPTASLFQVSDSTSARFSVNRQVGSNLALMFGYSRDWQQAAKSASTDLNHNRGWVTLSYDFSRPLGR
jgi:hypothetical protein